MELNKENIKKILGIITFAIVLFFLLENIVVVKEVAQTLIKVMSPFLIGLALAFILNIPMSFFERKLFKNKKNKLKRPCSLILSIIIVVLIISFIIKLVIPQLFSIIVMFISNVPKLANEIKDWALDLTAQYPDLSNQISNININWDSMINDMITFGTNLSKNLVTSSVSFIISLIGGVFDAIVSVVFSIYILNGKETLSEQVKKVLKAFLPEEKVKNILRISMLSKNTFQNFFTGQCTEAVIIGVLCFVGMIAFRLPYAATISILIGVTALIPIIGAFIGAIIGAILILSLSPIKAAIFVVFIVVLQQIESNAIYPKVVGDSVGLPGMWVLLAVIVGGGLGGMLGLLIGLPTASILYALLRNKVYEKLEKGA